MPYIHVFKVDENATRLGSGQEGICNLTGKGYHYIIPIKYAGEELSKSDVVYVNPWQNRKDSHGNIIISNKRWRKVNETEKKIYNSNEAKQITLDAVIQDNKKGILLLVGKWRNITNELMKGYMDYEEGNFGNKLIAVKNNEYGIDMTIYRKTNFRLTEEEIDVSEEKLDEWIIEPEDISLKENLAEIIKNSVPDFTINERELKDFSMGHWL